MFQERADLDADGIADVETIKALDEHLSRSTEESIAT
jgi:hypothetical protein